MRLGRRLVLVTAVTALLGGPVVATASAASASGSAAAGQGWVRCADLAPGAPEDVYLYPFGNPSHPTVLMHQGYGSVTEYMPLSAGQYTLAMRPPGASASSPPTVSTSFMVSAGSNYTVASLGSRSASGRTCWPGSWASARPRRTSPSSRVRRPSRSARKADTRPWP